MPTTQTYKPHLLIGVDAFNEAQLHTLTSAVEGWATWERIPEKALMMDAAQKVKAADILIGWPKVEWVLSGRVKFLQLPSAGYDDYVGQGVDKKEGLLVCNARGVYSQGVAEHCLSLITLLARRLPQYLAAMTTKAWVSNAGHSKIAQAIVCIVGLGDIGMELAWRCAGLGMQVIGVRRHTRLTNEFVGQLYAPDQLTKAVSQADHIISTLPASPATAHLFGKEVFEAMKPGACFYNVGRGTVVDEKELIRQLEKGHLAGAALDVFAKEPLPTESPLWTTKNLIITPHVGGYNPDHIDDKLSDLCAMNLRNYRAGQPLLNRLDLSLFC